MLQLLGFVGSTLIVVSLTMRSIIRLRIIGLLGAAAFIGYGFALQAWPVVATNVVTSSIHLYHLRSLVKEQLAGRERASAVVEPVRQPGLAMSQPVAAGGFGAQRIG